MEDAIMPMVTIAVNQVGLAFFLAVLSALLITAL